jgi:hypothetical protein
LQETEFFNKLLRVREAGVGDSGQGELCAGRFLSLNRHSFMRNKRSELGLRSVDVSA